MARSSRASPHVLARRATDRARRGRSRDGQDRGGDEGLRARRGRGGIRRRPEGIRRELRGRADRQVGGGRPNGKVALPRGRAAQQGWPSRLARGLLAGGGKSRRRRGDNAAPRRDPPEHLSRSRSRPAGDRLEPPSLLVEVDTTGIEGRGGSRTGEVPGVVAGLREIGCRVDGLMTVAPPGEASLARAAFDRVARLRDELGLAELSMGMSADLEQAVAAGATMVRLGTCLFGPRPQPRRL